MLVLQQNMYFAMWSSSQTLPSLDCGLGLDAVEASAEKLLLVALHAIKCQLLQHIVKILNAEGCSDCNERKGVWIWPACSSNLSREVVTDCVACDKW